MTTYYWLNQRPDETNNYEDEIGDFYHFTDRNRAGKSIEPGDLPGGSTAAPGDRRDRGDRPAACSASIGSVPDRATSIYAWVRHRSPT